MSEDGKIQIGVTLEGPVKKRFEAIKAHYGLQKNADLVRLLITQECEELGIANSLPRFEKINSDADGVKILDRELENDVQVYIKPNGITCSHDGTDDCDHVKFALGFPEVRELIRKHRKEGWKLPIV